MAVETRRSAMVAYTVAAIWASSCKSPSTGTNASLKDALGVGDVSSLVCQSTSQSTGGNGGGTSVTPAPTPSASATPAAQPGPSVSAANPSPSASAATPSSAAASPTVTVFDQNGDSLESQFGDFDSVAECRNYLGRYANALSAAGTVLDFPTGSITTSLTGNQDYTAYLTPWQTTDESVGFANYRKCQDPNFHNHLVKHQVKLDANGQPVVRPRGEQYLELAPDCTIDTLFSWGSLAKLTRLQQLIGVNAAAWPLAFPSPLFSTPSPSSTFYYGPIPIRLKIRPGVTYRLIGDGTFFPQVADSCTYYVTPQEFDSTILVRYMEFPSSSPQSMVDYILCGPGVIESWSFGTKEHHDEVVRDLAWQQNHDSSDFENYVKVGDQNQLFDTLVDGNLNRENDMTVGLRRLLRDSRLEDDQNDISVNPSVPSASRAGHFQTRFPVYFIAPSN